MSDRHFWTVSCPFCRAQVFEAHPKDGPILIREGVRFSVTTNVAGEAAVEISANWSNNELPVFRELHTCQALRLPLTPEEKSRLRAEAIDFLGHLAEETERR